MGQRTTDVIQVLALLGAVTLLVVVALREPPVDVSAPLPPGAYAVAVADTSMAVWVSPTGRATVAADDALEVELEHDADGHVLDEFVVTVDGSSFDVRVDALDELYVTAVAPVELPEEVVVVHARQDAAGDAPSDAAQVAPQQGTTPVFVRGESPMRDRVEGVARTIKRGGDGVAGIARRAADALDPRGTAE